MKKFKFITKNKIQELPNKSGVYCFKDKKNILYIGKASKIKERVKNHFNSPNYWDRAFIEKVEKIGFLPTSSEIEALIWEAELIKKYQPRFNIMWRDDKNYFYIAIQKNKDKIPYLFITHQPKKEKDKKVVYLGPFVDGKALKKTLKFLRKIFPFYTRPNHPNQKCIYCHLELCPGPKVNLKQYKKNIQQLIAVLKGKGKSLISSLKKEMKKLVKEEKFEQASFIRDKIFSLEKILRHKNIIEDYPAKTYLVSESIFTASSISQISQYLANKIEAYDISNIQGKEATGSMVTFINGKPAKELYRRFKIKTQKKPNDIGMLKEVLKRRFSHKEWEYPDAILIDGGKAQLNAAIEIKNKNKETQKIKVLSLAKGKKELFIENEKKPLSLKLLPLEIRNLIILLDKEAHRFAKKYHHFLRRKKIKIE